MDTKKIEKYKKLFQRAAGGDDVEIHAAIATLLLSNENILNNVFNGITLAALKDTEFAKMLVSTNDSLYELFNSEGRLEDLDNLVVYAAIVTRDGQPTFSMNISRDRTKLLQLINAIIQCRPLECLLSMAYSIAEGKEPFTMSLLQEHVDLFQKKSQSRNNEPSSAIHPKNDKEK